MIDTLKSILDSIVNFFTQIADFLATGIYDFFIWAFAQYVEYQTLFYIKAQIWSISFSWSVARQILSDLNISAFISDAWGSLPAELASIASFFGLPEALNIIVGGLVTKFVLRFMPSFKL